MNKVSVLVPSYNYGAYISDCLDSILNQTYKDIEIVIVDDCSTDNSIEIINKYLEKYDNIKLVKNKVNIGLNKSKRVGWGNCNGNYLAYLDSDDIMYEEFIEMHVDILDNSRDIDLVYCNYYDFRNDNIEDIVTFVDRLGPEHIYKYCVFSPWSVYRRNWFDKLSHTLNLPKIVGAEDWDFWITLASYGCKAYQIDNYLVYRRIHKNNSSWNPNEKRDDDNTMRFFALRHPTIYDALEADKYLKQNFTEYNNCEWLQPVFPRSD